MQKRETTQGMQVLTSDGEFLGTVEDDAPDGFIIRRSGGDSPMAAVPELWIATVDERVHLNRTGAEATAGWQAMQFRKSDKATPEAGGDRPQRSSATWLIFLALLAIVALVILMLMM